MADLWPCSLKPSLQEGSCMIPHPHVIVQQEGLHKVRTFSLQVHNKIKVTTNMLTKRWPKCYRTPQRKVRSTEIQTSGIHPTCHLWPAVWAIKFDVRLRLLQHMVITKGAIVVHAFDVLMATAMLPVYVFPGSKWLAALEAPSLYRTLPCSLGFMIFVATMQKFSSCTAAYTPA